jgi:uncharacterized protein (TIGR03118 family)
MRKLLPARSKESVMKMLDTIRVRSVAVAMILAVALSIVAPAHNLAASQVGFYLQANLVSDQPGVAAIQDPNLVNPWGIAFSPTSPFWVANNGTATSTIYAGDVNGSAFTKGALVVSILSGSPTGVVFNSDTNTSDFVITNGATSARAIFLFASQSGVVSGWNPAIAQTTAASAYTSLVPAVYTGLAIGQISSGASFLYLADFLNGKIDVLDSSFHLVQLDGMFSDPDMRKNYSPFNIQNIGGRLYVTYTRQSRKSPDEETGHGAGFVDVFDTDGHLLQRLISGSHLVAPWGLALAPADFGRFGNALLVGDFATGRILAFDAASGELLGELNGADGKPIVIDGLWGITLGNGGNGGDRNALYFAAGPDDETHGLFGSLRFVTP